MRQPSGWLLAAAVALFVGAVVAWVVSGPHRTIVHDRPRPGPTTVLVAPPRTPLPRDSGPKNNASSARKRATRRSGSSPAVTPRAQQRQSRTQDRRAPAKTRPTARRKTKRPAAPQRPSTSPQTTTPAPAPHDPTVTVAVPLPVGVCIRDVARLNHC